MNSRARRWLGEYRDLLLTCIATLAALAAFALIRPATLPYDARSVNSTYARDAEGFGVWYELLRREGLPVQRFERHLVHLDDDVATLIVAAPLSSGDALDFTEGLDRRHLERWIERGGRLIVARSSRGPKARSGVASTRLGAGTIVTLADAGRFQNASIGNGAHAQEALELVTSGGRAGAIAFDERVHGHAIGDHWWSLLPRAVVLGGAVVALGALLWSAGLAWRFEPIVAADVVRRDSTRAYIDAVASLCRRGRADSVLATNVVRVAQRVGKIGSS